MVGTSGNCGDRFAPETASATSLLERAGTRLYMQTALRAAWTRWFSASQQYPVRASTGRRWPFAIWSRGAACNVDQ